MKTICNCSGSRKTQIKTWPAINWERVIKKICEIGFFFSPLSLHFLFFGCWNICSIEKIFDSFIISVFNFDINFYVAFTSIICCASEHFTLKIGLSITQSVNEEWKKKRNCFIEWHAISQSGTQFMWLTQYNNNPAIRKWIILTFSRLALFNDDFFPRNFEIINMKSAPFLLLIERLTLKCTLYCVHRIQPNDLSFCSYLPSVEVNFRN